MENCRKRASIEDKCTKCEENSLNIWQELRQCQVCKGKTLALQLDFGLRFKYQTELISLNEGCEVTSNDFSHGRE